MRMEKEDWNKYEDKERCEKSTMKALRYQR